MTRREAERAASTRWPGLPVFALRQPSEKDRARQFVVGVVGVSGMPLPFGVGASYEAALAFADEHGVGAEVAENLRAAHAKQTQAVAVAGRRAGKTYRRETPRENKHTRQAAAIAEWEAFCASPEGQAARLRGIAAATAHFDAPPGATVLLNSDGSPYATVDRAGGVLTYHGSPEGR